ncbi:MAG: permease [Clostridiales bacterium]|nr:permease [Clostridiales bacterium]
MKKVAKRYRGFILAAIGMFVLTLFNRELGMKAIDVTAYSFKEMITVIPPVFILLGLLDIWVPKETMTRYMGEGSGIKGILLAFFIGSAAAGPLYGAFPVAAVFMKKGVKFSNIMIFIGAWSTTKIPMFLFEMTALGPVFAITRLLINIPGIIIIAMALSAVSSKNEIATLYSVAE